MCNASKICVQEIMKINLSGSKSLLDNNFKFKPIQSIFFLSFLQQRMIDDEFQIVNTNQSTILPEFCPPRCWVLPQDSLVSECPGISRLQKSPPTDSVVRL